MLFSLEVLEKLRKKGKLTDATYNELLKAVEKHATPLNKGGLVKKYADGGIVTPEQGQALAAQSTPAPKPTTRELFNQAMAQEQAAQAQAEAAKASQAASNQANLDAGLTVQEMFEKARAEQAQGETPAKAGALRTPSTVGALERGKEALANTPMVELESTGKAAMPQMAPQRFDGQFLTNQFQDQANQIMASTAKGLGYAKAIDNAVRAKQEADALINAEKDVIVSDLNSKLQQKMDEYKTMSVDPSRFWANRTTGDKIMIGIGLALSGLGGSTKGVEILQRAIDQDVNAQVANINKTGAEITAQRSVLKDMMDIYKDKSLAAEATKLAGFQIAEAKIKEMSLKTTNQIQQLEMSKLLGEIQAQASKSAQRLNAGVEAAGPVKDVKDLVSRLETIDNPELRKQAMSEFQTFKQLSSQLGQVDDIAGKFQPASFIGKPRTYFENIPLVGRVTKAVGFESPMSQSIEEIKPRILNIISSVTGQPLTERTAQLYDGFIPGVEDSQSDVDRKMQSLREFIRQGIEEKTPTLSSLGMVPRQTFREGAPVK